MTLQSDLKEHKEDTGFWSEKFYPKTSYLLTTDQLRDFIENFEKKKDIGYYG